MKINTDTYTHIATALLIAAHIAISDKFAASAMQALTVAGEDNAQDALPPCKQTTGMWGSVDPSVYYVCNPQTNRTQELRCPEGRGFFHGHGYYGCVPYEQWPACISASSNLQAVCDKQHLLQTWEALNPNQFYMCQGELQQPQLTNCEPGKGFVSAWVDERKSGAKIMGCASWEKWRAYMQCEGFY